MNDTSVKRSQSSILTTLKTEWLFVLVWILLIYRFVVNLCSYFYSSDVYHMLSAGDAINHYGVLRDDIFFVDSGHSIVIQQWFHNLVVFKIYDSFGKTGIFCYVFTLSLVFIFLIVKILRQFGVDFRLAFTSALLICLYCKEVLNVRPSLLTMVLLLIQIYLCEKYIRTGKLFYLLFLPILTLIEINCHSALWIIHFIFLLPYIVPIPESIKKYINIEDHHISIFKLALPILLMIASLFINPYGIDGIMILTNQSEISKLEIIELKSPAFSSKYAIVLLVMLLIAVFFYGKTKMHSSNVFMFIGTAIMMMKNLRSIQMFSIGIVLILCDLLLVIPIGKISGLLKKSKNLIVFLSYTLVIVYVCVSVAKFPFIQVLSDQPYDRVATPVLAVEYLNENATADSRIYTDFNNGAYISWSGYKIYFCSRTEGYCQAVNGGYDLVDEYLSVYFNTDVDSVESFEAFLDKYCFDFFVVDSKNRMLPYLMANEDYEAVLYGNGYVVLRTVSET